MSNKKILIVDDSPLIRELLSDIIDDLLGYEVIGKAADAHMAANLIMELKPDIITLDINMPKMDGLTFLEKLMKNQPMPVLIVSALSKKNSEVALKAIQLGAVDYITKPKGQINLALKDLSREIKVKLDACAISKINRYVKSKVTLEKKWAINKEKKVSTNLVSSKRVIAIGASIGGTVALEEILKDLPSSVPGIVVVQHIPPGFTSVLANRLNTISKLLVREASDRDPILNGQVLIARGGEHMMVSSSAKDSKYVVNIKSGEPVNHHIPSIEVLFQSMAQNVGGEGVGIILTGMGADGVTGLLAMKEVGSKNLAQDEASCTVFGMPKVAIEKGAVDLVLNLKEIHAFIKQLAS